MTMGKFTEFKLPLKSLAAGVHTFGYHLDKTFFVNMESADIRDANLDVQLTVTYKDDVYMLDFHITGEVTLLCDRCLDEMQFPIDATYHVMVKYGDDYRDDSDELIEIPWSDSTLNVAYMIYDTVSLAVPMKHVHPMGKCNRAMSAVLRRHKARPAGEDAELEEQMLDEIDSLDQGDDNAQRDTDPRWNALKGLASDDEA